MSEIATDRRRMQVEPDEEAHGQAVVFGRRFVEAQVGLARALCRIAATKTYVVHDCASIEEYGVRIGITARDARQLVDLGHALDAAPTAVVVKAMTDAAAGATAPTTVGGVTVPTTVGGVTAPTTVGGTTVPTTAEASVPGAAAPWAAAPTVADAVLAGAISVERAAIAGRFVATPELLRAGEDPVALATSASVRQVRATLRAREEERAQKQSVVPVALAVTSQAKDGFTRARALASEQAGTMLTEGETFAVVVEHYLDSFDPLRRGEGARRLPDTMDLPGRRTIPAEVQRAVRVRSGECCEVPGCPHRAFLAFAHIHAHRAGGSREAWNLLRLCCRHHVLFDAGRVRFDGWIDGRPTFRDAHGRRLTEERSFDPPDGGGDGGEDGGRDGGGDGDEDGDEDGGDPGRPLGDAYDRSDSGAGQVAERPPPEYGGGVAEGVSRRTSAEQSGRAGPRRERHGAHSGAPDEVGVVAAC